MEDQKIILTGDDGETIEFYVIETTMVGGVNYLLVSETGIPEDDMYVMKDMSAPEDEEAVYEFLDEGDELDSIGKIFDELLGSEE